MSASPASSTLLRSVRRRGNASARLSLEPNDYLGNIEWRGAQAGGGTPTGQRFAKIAPRVDSSYVANTAAQPVGIEFWVTDNTTARSQIFHANGNVTFNNVVNANVFNATSNVTVASGNIVLGSDGNITTVGNIDVNTGNITLTNDGNITTAGDIDVGAGNITLTSGGTINVGDQINIATGTITLDGGSGIITAPNSSITNTSLVQFQETTYDGGTVNGTIVPDTAIGSIQKYVLDGNITIDSLDNAVAGRSMTIILEQDGTGGHTLSSTMLFAGGNKTLSTAGGAIDIISVFYDGTTYYAALSKDYS